MKEHLARAALGYEAGDGRVGDTADPAAGTGAALVRTTTVLRGCEVVGGHRITGVRRVSRDAGGRRATGSRACAGCPGMPVRPWAGSL
ncbi:hypothetical protein ACF06L_10855 [Streptomyces sp. NPDC015408]|uniref:hypothetical protein n=1 Tax=Streptomyces sp. NPDC015408 TaxID=3364956 RepID=UPI0036F9F167